MWKFTGQSRPSFAVEPQSDQESVWDYPRPPICVEDTREVIVRSGDVVIAQTSNAIRVLETASPPTFYLPPADVDLGKLVPATGSSYCEWKGAATYWSVTNHDEEIPRAAWSYEQPSERFHVIRQYLSFYPALLNCTVDGESVRPQHGGFYGGWVTNEIVGPYKGEPGTAGW